MKISEKIFSKEKPSKQSEYTRRNEGLLAAITPIGLEFSRNEIRLGECYCRIYSVVRYPSEVTMGWLAKITSIPGTTVSIGCCPIDNADFVNSMSKTINDYRGSADSTKDQLKRVRFSKAAEDAEKIMKQIDLTNETVSGFSLEIMVTSRDKEDFNERCSRVESTTNAMGCRVRILSHLQQEAYKHMSPTYPLNDEINDVIERPFLLSTFTGGYPYVDNGFCDVTGYYIGRNSAGGIILFDPWVRSGSRTNSNITVVGSAGMGKSTAVKHIILSEIARGTKVFIIDPEGEYKDICLSKYVDGKWVDVAGGRGGLINPLQVRPAPKDDDDTSASEEDNVADLAVHLKQLNTFFQLYLPDLDDKHRALLNKTLVELYQKFNITWDTDISAFKPEQFPTMSDLYKLVIEKKKAEKKYSEIYDDLELLLYGAAEGADQGLWNGYTSVDSNSRCICLDTKAVTQMGGAVLAAQYFNVLSWCWQEMSKNKTERVMLVADECWMLIDPSCPQSLHFLRNVEKRARKYEGSVVVSTQDIQDFVNPAVKLYGQPVLDIPTVKLIFGMDGNALKEAVDVFTLNDAQRELVSSKMRGTALMSVGSAKTRVNFVLSDERLAMFGKGGGR